MDRPGDDPRPHHHRRQCRHAPGSLHEGRRHRSSRPCLGLGRGRDDRRPDSHSRQRRRTNRRRLSRKSLGNARGRHCHRWVGRHGSRHADEARSDRDQRSGARFRRFANERWNDFSVERGRDSHRRLDDPRHDRLHVAASAPADFFLCLRLSSHVHADLHEVSPISRPAGSL